MDANGSSSYAGSRQQALTLDESFAGTRPSPNDSMNLKTPHLLSMYFTPSNPGI